MVALDLGKSPMVSPGLSLVCASFPGGSAMLWLLLAACELCPFAEDAWTEYRERRAAQAPKIHVELRVASLPENLYETLVERRRKAVAAREDKELNLWKATLDDEELRELL